MNLQDALQHDKDYIMNELRKGNTDVLKGLPPHLAMSYGIEMQEQGYKDPSPIDYNAVGKSMLNRMKDSGIKEQLLKKIEEKEKEQAEKAAEILNQANRTND